MNPESRGVLAGIGALCLWALTACSTHTAAVRIDSGSPPRRAEAADVPFFPQEKYYCGPAALAMVLAWSGLPVTPEDLVSQVFTPGREGTLRTDIVAAARRHGRLAVPVTSLTDLLAELASGHPVLVFQNLALGWYPQWHFAVAVAYDLDAGEITLRSGLEPRRVTPLKTFERTWARGNHWAVVVLPPGALPQSADASAVVRAATGLERARRFSEAATVYAAIAQRWPDNHPALIGLGNARYAQGDLTGAEDAFRSAIERRPHEPAAWNNLAHTLAKQGRKGEAVEAAREALRLGGKDVDTYETTLREVSGY